MFTLTLISVFFSFAVFAQQTILSGQVLDESSQEPLEYATVGLCSPQDSSVLEGTVTRADGAFVLADVKPGTYLLQVQFVGYKPTFISSLKVEVNQQRNIGSISLQATQQLLDEISITGQQVSVYHKVDRQVYQAEQFQAAIGGTATDVLRNIPAVAVDANGNLTVRGSSGFTILLNGKPIQSDPSLILSQLPANAVEDVEIVTAPSAKYDPEGKAGIINIITRQGAEDGLYLLVNGQVGLPSIEDYDNAEQAQRYGGDFTLNYRKNRWDVSVGASYLRNDITGRREGDVFTIINDTLTRFPSDGERSFDEQAYTARATIGYTPNRFNSINLGFYAGRRSKDRTADILYNNFTVYQPEQDTINRISYFNENLRIRRGDFLISSLDFAHTFTNESQLSASLLYEYTMLGGPTTNLNLSWPSLQDTLQDQFNTNDNPLHGIRFQADYVHPLANGTIEAGYQYRYLDHTGYFVYQERTIGTNQFELIPEFSSQVDLRRQIHSVYGLYSSQWNKLTYSLGARVEVMGRNLVLTNDFVDTTYHYDFIQLYPSANLVYQLNDQFRLKAAYSRRVERTTTFKMNPFPEREHSETLEQGDPELRPEFINLVEAGLVRDFGDNSLFATAYFRHVENLVNRVNTVYNDTILNRIYSNVGQGGSLGLEAGLELNPTSDWQIYAGGNLYRYSIEGTFDNQPVNTQSWIYSINANITVKLAPTWNLQWAFNYLSARNTAQGEDSRFYSPNLTVKKSWLDGKITATAQWLNMDLGLLSTNEQRISTGRDDEFFTTTNYVYEVDVVMLNLSYRINQPVGKSRLIKSEFGDKEF
ncbi:TonB-dependent receptor domain-containing protein [Tunicatimonas pelagia]|uniref:TonB-dependent receptor domain-containing protein n=1 Tax=Tunicatimonas pelagia TaxID=931531 RepID=UPI002666CD66|nr:TonB-dependent receptor [Tunicatimonas pelagia]WKN43372.1 TonB-dependent receptor [Tunicatimonas pelagia]